MHSEGLSPSFKELEGQCVFLPPPPRKKRKVERNVYILAYVMKAHLINREKKNLALPPVDKISLMPQKEILLHGKRQKVKRINGDLPRPKKTE